MMGAEMEACWFLWDETHKSGEGQGTGEGDKDSLRCAVSSCLFFCSRLACFRYLQMSTESLLRTTDVAKIPVITMLSIAQNQS